jgi:hypothetical protein
VTRIIVAVIAALLLVGCGGYPPPDPPAIEQEVQSKDDVFLDALRDYDSSFYRADDESLVTLANTVCTGFRQGLAFEDVARPGLNSGMSPEQVGAVIGASITVYCPEQRHVLN